MPASPANLILASSSVYRRELLTRLGAEFTCISPDIDETPGGDEPPAELASRLARQKAAAVAAQRPDALVIGSDQVADLNGRPLGKPGNKEQAMRQLSACSGQELMFHTAVNVCCTVSGFNELHSDTTTVVFRDLTGLEIENYLDREQPWDCAGSFRSEALGPVLFTAIRSEDPTGLIGLPLIWLAGSLRRAGVELL